jgi:hypothetical protein
MTTPSSKTFSSAKIKKPKVTRVTTLRTTTKSRVAILNITLICIKKNELNNYLTYNTLYFWLEHTMVISVPICIVLVVLVSLIYIFLHFTKLLQYQDKLKNKHKKLLEQQKQCERMNQRAMTRSQNLNTASPLLNHQLHNSAMHLTTASGAEYDTDELHADGTFGHEEKLILTNERTIRRKQIQAQNLNKMYIFDLALYVFCTFPYTVMRLVLDLFAKDRIKVNLDFFIFYKFCFFTLHVHLIVKFFLMCAFNVKFRACLARCFAFRPSLCCVDEAQAAEDLRSSQRLQSQKRKRQQRRRKLTSDCCCVQLTCVTGSGGASSATGGGANVISEDIGSDLFGADPSSMNGPMDDEIKRGSALNLRNFDHHMNGAEYHSMEFDSNLHKYMHPADPDQESNEVKYDNDLNHQNV